MGNIRLSVLMCAAIVDIFSILVHRLQKKVLPLRNPVFAFGVL